MGMGGTPLPVPGSAGSNAVIAGGASSGKTDVEWRRERAINPPAISTSRMAPVPLNSTFGVGERAVEVLAQKEEERRVARQKYNFDDMIVFDGGVLADHESYGKKMIFRDFVHYALYHHKWGYLPKMLRKHRQLLATCFHDPIPFGNLRNKQDYTEYIGKQAEASPSFNTPGSIFQPYYGWVIAEYFVTTMRAKFDPLEPLIIYDIGCGNGTLGLTVLNFLAEQYPEVYATCEYHFVDMSPYVIPAIRAKLVHHLHHAHIHHISIHNWRTIEPRRCFVVAVELFSNMPHDQIIWTEDGACYEQWVRFEETDNLGSAAERNLPATDPLILRYLRYCRWLQEETLNSMKVLCMTDGRENIDPLKWRTLEPEPYDPFTTIVSKCINVHNPYRIAFLPTAQMLFLEVAAKFFPRHHAFFADYSSVQHGIVGINAPLVQVKMRIAKDIFFRRICDNLLTNAGMVDVCFPTDFEVFRNTYRSICGEHKELTNMTHPDFWKTFGGDKTAIFTTQTGYNPLLEDFQTFNVFASHHPSDQ